MDKSYREELSQMLIEEGRRGGSEAVQDFINFGSFDLLAYVANFKADWRLALYHPSVYRQHNRWKKSVLFQTSGTAQSWNLVLQEERNLALAEFGQLDIDFAERIRLRGIRKSYGLSWWVFRELVGGIGSKTVDQKLQIRVPPRLVIQVLGTLRRAWTSMFSFLIVYAMVQVFTRGCIDCSVLGVVLLTPAIWAIWRVLFEFSEGWLSSSLRLKAMSI